MKSNPEMTIGAAVAIVKYHLTDDAPPETKATAIEMVAGMETHNSIKKDELIKALRWLFDTYDFDAAKELIRCKDCKYHKTPVCHIHTEYPWEPVRDDDFCSRAER